MADTEETTNQSTGDQATKPSSPPPTEGVIPPPVQETQPISEPVQESAPMPVTEPVQESVPPVQESVPPAPAAPMQEQSPPAPAQADAAIFDETETPDTAEPAPLASEPPAQPMTQPVTEAVVETSAETVAAESPAQSPAFDSILDSVQTPTEQASTPSSQPEYQPVAPQTEAPVPAEQQVATEATQTAETPPPVAIPPTKKADPDDVKNNKLFAILAYIGILCLVPLLAKKDSPFAQFHAKQGVLIFGAWVAIFLLGKVFRILSPAFDALLMSIGFLAALVFSIIGILHVVNGNMERLPFIGQYAEKINI